MGPTKRGKGTKIMAIAAVTSLPLAVNVDSASPHESQLVEETLAGTFHDFPLRRAVAGLGKSVRKLDASSSRLATVNIALTVVILMVGIVQIVLMVRGH